MPPKPPRPRRALSSPGGRVVSSGDARWRRILGEALAIPSDADARALTHGFHSYPARFHPLLCRRLLAESAHAGTVVLDPFVGSGTTLVEAALRGATGRGVDANPLAVDLAALKATVVPADARARLVERALGKGNPSRLFARKTEELARGMAAFAAAVPRGTPPPDVRLGDARKLSHVADRSVDVILTSPPYLGTYDYAQQHERRFGWLGVDASRFVETEIGARRRSRDAADALGDWQRDVDAFVAEFARVLKKGALAFVAIGDSAVGTRAIAGDAAIRAAAERAHLHVLANAAEERPNFYRHAGGETRREHLLLITNAKPPV